MRNVRTKDTKPELDLRRELFALGLRYRLTTSYLPCRPDIVFGTAKVAVFVDGCFLHGCSLHFVQPKNNAEFWQEKIATNRHRDARNDEELELLGWQVVRVWEHEDMNLAARDISDIVRKRRG